MFCEEEFAIDSDWIASCCWVCRALSLEDSSSMSASTRRPIPESIESLSEDTKSDWMSTRVWSEPSCEPRVVMFFSVVSTSVSRLSISAWVVVLPIVKP